MPKNSTPDAPPAVTGTDGSFRTEPRPGVGPVYQSTTVSGAPLPGASAVTPPVGARNAAPVPEPGPQLPFAHVAWQFVGREVQRLKGQAEGIERDLARGVFGASGQQNAYLIEKQSEDRDALAEIRKEIERLLGMSDHECRVWAFEHGAR